MQTQRLQDDVQSPAFSKADAEEMVRKAAASYVLSQIAETRSRLWNAVQALGQFDPPIEECVGYAPSHQFMLGLMPKHLRWPDPLNGDALFD